MASNRNKRHIRIRKSVRGTGERPRLSVYRSIRGIYVQIIDDDKSITLIGMSDKHITTKKDTKKNTKKEQAFILGKEIAKAALDKNIKTVVFDRGGNKYHGRVEEIARGARENGLIF